MQEPHKKGIANHLDPESCAGVGNRVGEALTGAHADQPSSSEITSPGVPTLHWDIWGRHTQFGAVKSEMSPELGPYFISVKHDEETTV